MLWRVHISHVVQPLLFSTFGARVAIGNPQELGVSSRLQLIVVCSVVRSVTFGYRNAVSLITEHRSHDRLTNRVGNRPLAVAVRHALSDCVGNTLGGGLVNPLEPETSA